MPRRTLITASLLVLLLAAIALLPYLPPVRGLIVDRVVDALGDAGIDVTYDGSSGNAWRGVTLEGVRITGAGSDVAVDRLRVGYFLPSLLGGELPLDVAIGGATGNVDLEDVLDEVTAPAASGSGRSISVRLRSLDLRDIDVDVVQLPFTLPDTSLRQLVVSQDGTNLQLDGSLVTPDGEAVVSGRYESLTGSATVRLVNADASMGRHWWGGVTGGQVTGELRVRGRTVEGDFVLRGGSVSEAGLIADDVAGTVTMRLPVISADLRGTAFGGPVEATGVVNVDARRWEANATAQPALAEAADWLALAPYPDGLPLELTGRAALALRVTGWEDFTLDGTASGEGAVEGVPLDDLDVSFRRPADGGLRANGAARLGDGPVEFTIAPGQRGDRLTLNAQGVSLEALQSGLGTVTATVDVGMGSGGNGTIRADWRGELGGRGLNAVLDATLDADGLQGFVSGADDSGLEAVGAFVLDGGRLQGQITSEELALDALSPGARVALAVNGPVTSGLDGLQLSLSVTGDGPVRLTTLPGELGSAIDLRGELTGTLDVSGQGGPAVRDLSGALGPVTAAGAVLLSPFNAELALSLAPTPLSLAAEPLAEPVADSQVTGADRLSATVAVPASSLSVTASGVSWNGTVTYSDASAGPARLAPGSVEATLSVPEGGQWSLVANSPTGDLVASADANGFAVDFTELLVVLDDPSDPSRTSTPSLDDRAPLAALALSGSLVGPLLTVDLVVTDAATLDLGTAAAAVEEPLGPASAGSTALEAARFRLPGVLDLTGQVDIDDARVTLTGGLTVAEQGRRVPLEATIAWGDGAQGESRVPSTIVIGSAGPSTPGPLRATYEAGSGDITLVGALDLGLFVPATDAVLSADLSGRMTSSGLTGLSGEATVSAERPTPLTATVEGAGSRVLLEVTAVSETLPVVATGELDLTTFASLASEGESLLTASVGPFTGITVNLTGANGTGTIEPTQLGPLTLPALPWSLAASWGGDGPPTATVEVNDNPLSVTLTAGALEVTGSLELPVEYGGERYLLRATVPGGAVDLDDLPATPVSGSLTHLDGGDDRAVSENADAQAADAAGQVLSVEGTLAELRIGGQLTTAHLAPMLPAGSRPAGLLTLSGTIAPLDGPTYRADLELSAALSPEMRESLPARLAGRAEMITLTGSLSGTGTDLSAHLEGERLSFNYQDGTLDLVANEARLEPLIGLAGVIDGSLALEGDGSWGGSLNVSASMPVGDGPTDVPATSARAASGEQPIDLAESLDDPLLLDLTLHGRGETLEVVARASGPARSRLSATGTLAPAPALNGSLEAAGGIVSGSLAYSQSSGLTAELASPELLVEDYLAVPPLDLEIELGEGNRVELSGTWISATADLASGALAGDVDLPLTLLDSAARFTAELTGTLADPRATAQVRGEGLSIDAEADLASAHASLSLDPAVAATFVPAAAAVTGSVRGPVEAEADWSGGQAWELRAVATAASPAPAAAEFDLELTLVGEAATYQGELAAFLRPSGAEVARVSVSGTGGDLEAGLDLATIDWAALGGALGIDLDLTATGAATLETQPFAAGLDVDMTGTVAGVVMSLRGSAPDDLRLTLDSDDMALEARLAWNEERKALIDGVIGGRPVTGWLDLSDDLRTGSLSLDAPGARVEAALTTVQPGPPTAQMQRNVEVTATLFEDPSDEQTPLVDLYASGTVTPTVQIEGKVDFVPLEESAAFRLAPADASSALAATLAWRGLELAYLQGEQHVTLSGAADLGDLLTPYLPEAVSDVHAVIDNADLTWSPRDGFGGEIAASLNTPLLGEYGVSAPVIVRGSATANAPPDPAAEGSPAPLVLSTAVSARPGEPPGPSAEARATVVVPANLGAPSSMPLAGELTIDLELPQPAQSLNLAATLGGTFAAPDLAGTVTATGVVDGSGNVSFRDGRGTLSLAGSHVELMVAGGLTEWSADASLRGLPLAEWLPQVTEPMLSLEAAASSGSGGVTVSGLRLEAGASSLSGAATVMGGVRVALQAQVDLADVRLGDTQLQGLLRGPMVLTAASLADLANAHVTAQLDGAGIGVSSVDATASGVLQVGGTVSQPNINALLSGGGDLRGTLQLSASPAVDRFELRSTLGAGGVSSNFRVAATADSVSASGQLRYQDAVLLLADGPQGIEFVGAGRLDGWQALLSPGLDEFTAAGPISAVSEALRGQVDLRVGGREDLQGPEPWLRASVADVVIGGQELDDLAISAQEPGSDVVVAGQGLSLSVSPADLGWQVAVEGQALPGSLILSLSGSGQGTTGEIQGALSSAGSTGGANDLGLDLTFDADLGQATFAATGQALGGRLTLDGARAEDGAWSGQVALSQASVAGFAVSANGVLQGRGPLPQAVIATAALRQGEIPVSVAGRVSLGGSGITFDQTAALPMLAAPLRMQGQLLPDIDLTLSAAAPGVRGASGAASNLPRGSTRIFATGSGLSAAGEVEVPVGPARLTLDGRGPDGSPRLEVRLTSAPSVAAQAPLIARDLPELVAGLSERGLVLSGSDAAHGTLRLRLTPAVAAELDGFGLDLAGFRLGLSGTVSPDAADLSGALRLPLDLPAGAQAAGQELPLQVTASDGTWSVTSSGTLGNLAASLDTLSSALLVDLDLALPTDTSEAGAAAEGGLSSAAIVGRVTYDPQNGPAGTLALTDVSLEPGGIGELTLNADTAIADGRIGGSATLDTAGGRVTLSGNAALAELFPALAPTDQPPSARGSSVELRLRTLELGEFPVVAAVAPHLRGALSGVVQLRNGFLLGQVVAPELAVGDRLVPASLQISGPPSDLDAALQLAGSLFTADLGTGRIAGSSRLERFPLDLMAEAFVGPTDVTAFLTGVVRFDLPSTDPAAGYVRLATEELTLERAGITTRGEVALTYEDRHLTVQRADFGGRGAWHAEGVLGPDLLDFTLEANDADFSPLLGLVPALSRFAVGAAGSFTFAAQGDFGAPEVSFESDLLEVTVAGSRFRIENTDVSLSGDDLSASTTVRGLEPLTGAVEFGGDATVMLEPLALRSVDFGFSGDLDVPGVGQIGDVRGTINQNPQNLPVLFLTGELGETLTVRGTLVPLDLHASGAGLELAVPSLLIADSTATIDLSLRGEEGGVVVGGSISADEIIVDPSARDGGQTSAQGQAAAEPTPVAAAVPAPDAAATPPTPAAGAPTPAQAVDAQPTTDETPLTDLPPIESAIEQLEADDATVLASTPTVAEAEAQGARNALAAVRFDDLRITAPQRVQLSMNIASLEAALDLTLAGTAAQPRLSGEARALRGSLRFSGREFTVDRAVASFTPNRGVLPSLDVAAHADFEKTRVLAGSPDVEFAAPSDSNTFTVQLAFSGPVELEEDGGIRFDVRPALSSDALVEVAGEGVGSGVRPLSEAELLSLITLGRIEFGSDLIGAGGIGGAVAQGALDTAVDLLVVGELQNALREALGLDVVEIRTTAISSLLGGEGAQPFGVSVRLGGYLNPDLFASYRIGTADPSDPGVGFTNEVALQYGLGPLNLDVLGRLDFPTAGTLNDPRPELGVGVSYDFGRALSVDTGVTLSTERSVVSFGVALRW